MLRRVQRRPGKYERLAHEFAARDFGETKHPPRATPRHVITPLRLLLRLSYVGLGSVFLFPILPARARSSLPSRPRSQCPRSDVYVCDSGRWYRVKISNFSIRPRKFRPERSKIISLQTNVVGFDAVPLATSAVQSFSVHFRLPDERSTRFGIRRAKLSSRFYTAVAARWR